MNVKHLSTSYLLTCMAVWLYTVSMNESSNIKECDHLSDNFAVGNDGVYYCTFCDKSHEWKDGEIWSCKSYYDEKNVLQDCTCGKCK